jgi:hypothetical protein
MTTRLGSIGRMLHPTVSYGDGHHPNPAVCEPLHQRDRRQRRVDDGQIVGDRRDQRHQVQHVPWPAVVREVDRLQAGAFGRENLR